MTRPVRLSAVVITQDEEANIKRCLSALRFADEIVVVDALSEDGTARIATELGARVIARRWTGFADQKQFAIDQAKGDWVLLVDADEEVTPGLAEEIRDTIASAPPEKGWKVKRQNQFLGKWIHHGPWTNDYHIRLFKRGAGHIARRPVHEGVQLDGTAGILKNPLNHYTHQTLSQSMHRLNRYTSLEAEERVGRRKVRLIDLIVPPLAVFLNYFVFKGCWREGVHGFLLSATTAMYRSVLYLKILVLQNMGHPVHSPSNIADRV